MPRVPARTLAFALVLMAPAPLLAQTPSASVPETHTVKQHDTLWDLARQYFGDPVQWPRIYQLNTTVVEDPHWIYPGEVLRLRSDSSVASVPDMVPAGGVPVAAPADTTMAVVTPPTTVDTTGGREAVVAEAVPAQPSAPVEVDTTPLFPQQAKGSDNPMYSSDFSDQFRAVTRADFYQAGFMTEGRSWPLGTLQGRIDPSQVEATLSSNASLFSQVAIDPPAAGAYQVGDTLLAVQVDARGFGGFGSEVVPIGVVRVTDVSRPRLLGVVIAQYGRMDPGVTRVMMAEKFTDRRGVRPQPLADGTEGTLIAFRGRDQLRGVGDIAFIDKGHADGVQLGDVIEVHRTTATSVPLLVAETVARAQVVHVGEKSSTVRITWVSYPDIGVGTRWKLVARLPG